MRGPWAWAILVFGLGLWTHSHALGEDQPRLKFVQPHLIGEHVSCRLQTQGLPGQKQLETMNSGLESAIEFQLSLRDENGRHVAQKSLSLRMGFDLWDEVFSVKKSGKEWRFQSLADLQNYLSDFTAVPVIDASLLDQNGRYQIEVGLVVHALAPDEQQRVEDVIVGDGRPRRKGQDQQEASVSLGRLIRIFYKGDRDTQDGQSLVSSWFKPEELIHAAD